MKNNGRHTSVVTPAFLGNEQRGFESKRPPQGKCWRPRGRVRRLSRALRALPKLTTELGFDIARYRDADVEVLSGHPTTIAFFADKKLTGLFVVPFTEQEARDKLGLPPTIHTIPSADALYEEMREVRTPDDLLAEAQYDAWGL